MSHDLKVFYENLADFFIHSFVNRLLALGS